ncbi:MAG TPA: hypothetical protein VEX15_00575 [Nocardioidaceae bacterium]|nr:hypothetical protein [Nocardioidaceae bacterium]
MTRIYLPLGRAGLATAWERAELGPAPLIAYAVTPGLRAAYGAERELDELEYAAYELAVDASRTALASDERRRLVVAADAATVRADEGEVGRVVVPEPVPWSAVVSIHADTDDLRPDGGDDAELAWYAPQETPDLLRS